LLISSVVACGKKTEECANLRASLEAVRDAVDVDVGDDKFVDRKTTELDALMQRAQAMRALLTAHPPTDGTVRSATEKYRQALSQLIEADSSLRKTFVEVSNADLELGQRLVAVAAATGSFKKFWAETSFEEHQRLAAKVGGLGASPDDLETMAHIIERSQFAGNVAQAAAGAHVRALREQARVLRSTAGLDSTYADLEGPSRSKRDAFRDARSALEDADGSLVRTCSLAK
jgi:hypothetical protein